MMASSVRLAVRRPKRWNRPFRRTHLANCDPCRGEGWPEDVSWLLPNWIVTGRSVFGRSVRQGVRKNVDSSCNPPESVSTNRARSVRHNRIEVTDCSSSLSRCSLDGNAKFRQHLLVRGGREIPQAFDGRGPSQLRHNSGKIVLAVRIWPAMQSHIDKRTLLKSQFFQRIPPATFSGFQSEINHDVPTSLILSSVSPSLGGLHWRLQKASEGGWPKHP